MPAFKCHVVSSNLHPRAYLCVMTDVRDLIPGLCQQSQWLSRSPWQCCCCKPLNHEGTCSAWPMQSVTVIITHGDQRRAPLAPTMHEPHITGRRSCCAMTVGEALALGCNSKRLTVAACSRAPPLAGHARTKFTLRLVRIPCMLVCCSHNEP